MRKPDGMSFESFIDQQIREAEERGAFAELPGKGRPLADLDQRDEAWWIKRKLAEEGLAMPLPPGLELRREVERFRAGLCELGSEAAVRDALDALNARIGRVNATLIEGPPSNVVPLRPEEVLAAWRQAREAAG